MSDLSIQEPTDIAPSVARMTSTGDPIMDMAQRASNNNDIETLHALLDIRNKEKANAARDLFNVSFSKAQAEFPIVPKRGTAHNNIKYARIEDIIQGIGPVLAKYGLSIRHKTTQESGIVVTAILAHVGGHFEEDVFVCEADKTGSKNAIQAIKSSITYARRTTLENLLGLASRGEDDDAFAAGDTDVMSSWRERIGDVETIQQANKARADLMASTEVTPEERTKIGHVWTAKLKTIKKAE